MIAYVYINGIQNTKYVFFHAEFFHEKWPVIDFRTRDCQTYESAEPSLVVPQLSLWTISEQVGAQNYEQHVSILFHHLSQNHGQLKLMSFRE